MLSRLAFRSNNLMALLKPASSVQSRVIHQDNTKQVKWDTTFGQFKEGPERDLVNFPRQVRLIEAAKVRLGFLPDAWFTFLYPKTGVTGPYVLYGSLVTFLFSKEIFVCEHEFYTGISILIMIMYAHYKFGPMISNFLDKELDDEIQGYKDFHAANLNNFDNSIKEEEKSQWRAKGQKMLFDAKKENVALQQEAVYRSRLMQAYTEVKKRLDYQVELQNAQRRIEQKHMVDWIISSVRKSITPAQEKETLQKCIVDLKNLAAHA